MSEAPPVAEAAAGHTASAPQSADTTIRPRYDEILPEMTTAQLVALWTALHGLGHVGTEPMTIDAEHSALVAALLPEVEKLEHIDVVLAVQDHPDTSILEKLMSKPLRNGPQPQASGAGGSTRQPRTPRDPSAPKAVVTDGRVITGIKPNPKKPSSASFTRYALYKEGMTVAEFIAAGGTKGDVQYDAGKGFITLGDAAAAA